MENKKLTWGDISLYPEAKIWYNGQIWDIATINIWGDEIELYDGTKLSPDFNDYFISIEDCKLILRPPSSLTAEEKEKIKTEIIDKHIFIEHLSLLPNYTIEISMGDMLMYDELRKLNIDVYGFEKDGRAIYL